MPLPMVGAGDDKVDVFSRLLRDRILLLGSQVDDEVGNLLVAQMLYLGNEDSSADMTLYINSPGGSVSAGMAIFDTMQFVPCDTNTVCFGTAASMGAFLLGAGTKGKRRSLPNSRIMIHQPLGGAQGQAADIEIQAKEILFIRALLCEYIADYTGQPVDKVEDDCDRDFFMTPEEAKDYGIIDEVRPPSAQTRPPPAACALVRTAEMGRRWRDCVRARAHCGRQVRQPHAPRPALCLPSLSLPTTPPRRSARSGPLKQNARADPVAAGAGDRGVDCALAARGAVTSLRHARAWERGKSGARRALRSGCTLEFEGHQRKTQARSRLRSGVWKAQLVVATPSIGVALPETWHMLVAWIPWIRRDLSARTPKSSMEVV